MTAAFNGGIFAAVPGCTKVAHFDARAFNIPREEVANYFLWRARDWERNSVAMYCGSCHSHREMHGQGKADQHEMLHAKGRNWTTDLTDQQRNGTWVYREAEEWVLKSHIQPTYESIGSLVAPLVNCDKLEA